MAVESEPKDLGADDVSVGQPTEVSVEEIVERIRKALYLKGATALVEDGADRHGLPAAGRGQSAMEFDSELYQSLHQTNVLVQTGLQVHYELGWRTPIIGHVWMAVRRRIHQEISIYVDAIMAQQSSLNAHLVRALTWLVEGVTSPQLAARMAEIDAQAESIRALQQEVAELKERIGDLERERAAASGAR